MNYFENDSFRWFNMHHYFKCRPGLDELGMDNVDDRLE